MYIYIYIYIYTSSKSQPPAPSFKTSNAQETATLNPESQPCREALTALCNICDSPEGRAALSTELRTLKTLASGLSNRMSPWKVLEGMGGGPESEAQRESLCDAAGIVQSLGSRGGSGIFLTEGGGVAAGLGCMMECGEGDVFSSALAACDSLAAEISNRHRLVDGMHAGAVLAKLRVHFTAEDVDAEERELAMRLAVRLIDGVGRELSLAEHPDGSVRMTALNHLPLFGTPPTTYCLNLFLFSLARYFAN
jgi:hypothetical protein